MARKSSPSSTERLIRPVEASNSWLKQDYLVVLLNLLLKFGDSVEIYLPGVINQIVSCEMGVSDVQEAILGISLYVAIAVATIITVPLSNRYERRSILLVSLYTSVLFSVLCSVAPNNYLLLLAARLLIGACVGLNISSSSVFMAKLVSSRKVYNIGTFIDSILFAAGGGWIAVLGFLSLEQVGWRWFVLWTSLPVFVPPIFMLHCCLNNIETPHRSEEGKSSPQNNETNIVLKPNFKKKLLKASVMNFVNILQGYGSILLLPVLLRVDNQRTTADSADKCSSVVQGSQFLILAGLTGGAHVVGRVAGYMVHGRVSFRLIQGLLALVMALCYGAMFLDNLQSIEVIIVAMAVVNVVYSMTRLELKLMECDIDFFGEQNIAMASGVVLSIGHLGAVLGTVFAVFLKPYVAVICMFAFSWVQVITAYSFTEY